MSHIPVLLEAVLFHLASVNRLIDGTLGAGGHSRALLEAGVQEILGLDADQMAIDIARVTLAPFGQRAHIIHNSYANMAEEAHRLGWNQVDGILLDLGLSSMQLDTPERGFAFMHDGPLDMRFNPQGDYPPASEWVNELDEADLADLIYKYGEETNSRRLARVITAGRPYETTRQLADAIEHTMPRRKGDKIHPATRVFQALRIAVNHELDVVEKALPTAIDLLEPGGRLGVISFHSLEDRVVKQAFKLASTDCICPPKIPICVCGHHANVRLITPKPLVADEREIARNPRSRSAKLRLVEKLDVNG